MQKRILTVDDSKTMRDMLFVTLKQAGYSVVQAEDGQDGLTKLADELKEMEELEHPNLYLEPEATLIRGYQLHGAGDYRGAEFALSRFPFRPDLPTPTPTGDDYLDECMRLRISGAEAEDFPLRRRLSMAMTWRRRRPDNPEPHLLRIRFLLDDDQVRLQRGRHLRDLAAQRGALVVHRSRRVHHEHDLDRATARALVGSSVLVAIQARPGAHVALVGHEVVEHILPPWDGNVDRFTKAHEALAEQRGVVLGSQGAGQGVENSLLGVTAVGSPSASSEVARTEAR